MDVTVLISTFNNSKRLRITLEAFRKCYIPERPKLKWELVLVNNNCSDDTEEVINEYKNYLPIVCVKEPIQGLSRARNAGLRAASGNLVIFTDDDVTPCKEWISIYWSAYLDSPTGYFWGGPIESEFEGEKPDEELLYYAPPSVQGLDFGNIQKIIESDELFVSANWSCPKKILLEVGGFDESLGLNAFSSKKTCGEESDLMLRLKTKGFKGFYLPEAKIKHFVTKSKCTIQHIGNRIEKSALSNPIYFYSDKRFPRLFGIPISLYFKLIITLGFLFIFSPIKKIRLSNYFRFKRLKGRFIGYAFFHKQKIK
jgi:glucosyl-dolichyl phosphate glucuronosyltransferase